MRAKMGSKCALKSFLHSIDVRKTLVYTSSHFNNYCTENTSPHIKTCPYLKSCVYDNPCARPRLCTSHQILLFELRRFQCSDPKPASYAVLVRAKWPSSSTRPADARTKPRKRRRKKPVIKHTTCRYAPGLRRNARRWPRPPGSRNPDGFPPCSQLQHGLSTPELQPADKPADRTALRGTETLMDHKGCSWTHRLSANRNHLGLTAGASGAWLTATREDKRRSWTKASTVQGRNNAGGNLPAPSGQPALHLPCGRLWIIIN